MVTPDAAPAAAGPPGGQDPAGATLPADLPLRRPEWVAHVLDGERAVLLHLPSGRRVVLSPEATAIWQEVVGSGSAGVTAGEVSAALAPRYAADPEVIAHDVTVLLGTLLDEQLVAAVRAGPDAADGGSGAPGGGDEG